jgi:uncharacterized Zn finger protein
MLHIVPKTPFPAVVRSNCPDCDAELAILRIIPGRAAEYWTMRCTECGGIHLDIVDATPEPSLQDSPSPC